MKYNQLKKGFYYHFKHDRNGPINNCAYEVLGAAINSDFEEDDLGYTGVIYRPLYVNELLAKEGSSFFRRASADFISEKVNNGIAVKRFTEISDREVISKLEAIRDEMYN